MNSNLTGDQKALWTRLMDDSRTRMASKKDRLFKHECNDANGAKYAEGKAPKSEFCDGQSGNLGFQAGKPNKHLQQLDAGTFNRRKACPRLAVTPDANITSVSKNYFNESNRTSAPAAFGALAFACKENLDWLK